VENFIDTENPHILCLTEHHLKSVELNQIHFQGFTCMSNFCRQSTKCGGVCIYVKDNIVASEVNNVACLSVEGNCELGAIKCIFGDFKIYIITVYRPPKLNHNEFYTVMTRFLDSVYNKNTKIIVLGDFNIDTSMNTFESRVFVDFMKSYGLVKMINNYTREFNGSTTTIDNIFTDIEMRSISSSVLISALSDHHAQMALIDDIPISFFSESMYKIGRPFTQNNILRFKTCLKEENWLNVFQIKHPDEKYMRFIDTFLNYFNNVFPIKTYKAKVKTNANRIKFSNTLLLMKDRVKEKYINSKTYKIIIL
jgi:exonuclease III